MGAWALSPVLLYLSPSLGGLIEPATDFAGYVSDVGYGWLALGVAGVLLRVLQLTLQQSLFIGVIWATKIITDPTPCQTIDGTRKRRLPKSSCPAPKPVVNPARVEGERADWFAARIRLKTKNIPTIARRRPPSLIRKSLPSSSWLF
jgi:hypothetical protein